MESVRPSRNGHTSSTKDLHVGLDGINRRGICRRCASTNTTELDAALLPFLNGKDIAGRTWNRSCPFQKTSSNRTHARGRASLWKKITARQLLSYRIVSPGMRGTIVIMDDLRHGNHSSGKGQPIRCESAIRGMEMSGKHVLFLLGRRRERHGIRMRCGRVWSTEARSDADGDAITTLHQVLQVTDCVEVAY